MIAAVVLALLLTQAEDFSRLLKQLEHDDPAVRDAASAAIHRLGERVIPDLERTLAHPSLEVRERAVALLRRIPSYVFQSLLSDPGFPEVRRRWNAVIDAVIGKHPIPRALWDELNVKLEEIPAQVGVLEGLRDDAAHALKRLVWDVGVDRGGLEGHGGGMEPSMVLRDYLPIILLAEPDEVSFQEVYGTLLWLQRNCALYFWNELGDKDIETAVRLLVEVRRRKELPVFVPPVTLDAAWALACRGPVVNGWADALGRAFANGEHGGKLQIEVSKSGLDGAKWSTPLNQVYHLLIRVEESVGRPYFHAGLLGTAKAAVPAVEAPLPECHRALFERVTSRPIDAAARRVVLDLLSNLPAADWEEEEQDRVAELLRTIGKRVGAAAK